MVKASETQRDVIDNLRLDVGIIKNQMSEVRELQKTMSSSIAGFSYAKQVDVEGLSIVAKSVDTRLTILEQKIKPIEKIYYLVLGALVTGIIGLGFFLLQKALQS